MTRLLLPVLILATSPALLADFVNEETVATTPLVEAARERLKHKVRYEAAYVSLAYPNGDVPANTGVCSDLVIRAYRGIGIDLQQSLHEDIKANFTLYPSRRIWGLTEPDPNIDHRRVPNLQVFFKRHGKSLDITDNAQDYRAGDVVTWHIDGEGPHIGIVANEYSPEGTPLIIHNFGSGPEMENILFDYTITGHYRYAG